MLARLPYLDTCCCSCFGVTQVHYINKVHDELMRKGKDAIPVADTLTSGCRFEELPEHESTVYCTSDDCYQCK